MKLWIRDLDCNHSRPTNISFLCGEYSKPIIGNDCYCRQCMKDSKIINVRESKLNISYENRIYSIFSEEFPNVVTQGKTEKEAKKRLQEVYKNYLFGESEELSK